MRFGEKIVVFILRPIYRTFFKRLVWWNLTKARTFFFAEMSPQLVEMRRKLEEIESGYQQRTAAIDERLRAIETNNAAQWDALEQLLLAMFRQPEARDFEVEWSAPASQKISISTAAELSRVHAASSIR